MLRGILLGGSVDWSAPAEALLHFAARAEHVDKTIRPARDSGSWVVCDRFFDSTMAYQGFGQGADCDFIAGLIGLLGYRPELTIVLDVPEAMAVERRRQRGGDNDRYERLDAAFHARVRQGFRAIAAAEAERCVLVDASRDVDAVHTAIMAAVWTRFGLPGERTPR
jgi:dTMP kinase